MHFGLGYTICFFSYYGTPGYGAGLLTVFIITNY